MVRLVKGNLEKGRKEAVVAEMMSYRDVPKEWGKPR
jgi:hypothetical protein